VSSEAELRQEVADARRELEQLRRITTEAMRGMSDEEILALRDRLERGDGDGSGVPEAAAD
jgi:hypothetical protein